MEKQVEDFVIYRKSRYYAEEPIRVSVESAHASISAWRYNIDGAIEKLREGGIVRTPYFNFYGKALV